MRCHGAAREERCKPAARTLLVGHETHGKYKIMEMG